MTSKTQRRMKLVLTSKPYYRITEQCPSDQYPPRRVEASKSQTHTGKSILRYPGGKTRAIKLILPKLLAQNASRLISPFFGGGSIEFAWAAAMPDGRVEGMDLYAPVVRFWQHALKEPVPSTHAAKIGQLVHTDPCPLLVHQASPPPMQTRWSRRQKMAR